MSLEGIYFSIQELSDAIKSDNTDLFFEYYLNLNSLVYETDGFFHRFIKEDNLELIEHLIKEKAYLLTVDHQGYIPIELAVKLEKWEIVKLFLRSGQDINLISPAGQTLTEIVLDNSKHWRYEQRFEAVKELLKLGVDPFAGIVKWLINREQSHLGEHFAESRQMIDRFLFSDDQLMIPEKYQQEYILLLLNKPDITAKFSNWMSSNHGKIKEMFFDRKSGLTFAESLFLTQNGAQGVNRSVQIRNLLKPEDFSMVLSLAAQKIIKESQPLDSIRIDECNSLGFKVGKDLTKMTLMEACFDYYYFWIGQGAWEQMIGNQHWISFIKSFILPIVVFDQKFVISLIQMYLGFSRRFNSKLGRLNVLFNHILEYDPKLMIENVKFECCDLLNYCIKHGFQSLANRILQGCSGDQIRLNCQKRNQCNCGQTICGHLSSGHLSSGGCGSIVLKSLNNAQSRDSLNLQNQDVELTLNLLHSKGFKFDEFIDQIRRTTLELHSFKLIAKYVIKSLNWSELDLIYRTVLEGKFLKELDQQKSFVFQRKDPISDEDLQEIDSSRLVVVNLVPWDIENLVQYVTKVTKGQNAFDTNHPLKGRQIWINQLELKYLYSIKTEISDENLGRISNLNDSGSGSDSNADSTQVGSGRNGKITYGDLLKNYLEIEPLLSKIDRTDFDELYRICSIFWARGEPFEQEISQLLTKDELSDWKKRWVQKMSNQSMPSELPSGLSSKIHSLKLLQMAALEIWFYTTMKNKTTALMNISQICFNSFERIYGEIEGVLSAENCVMVFSYYICRGYIRSKIIWDRME